MQLKSQYKFEKNIEKMMPDFKPLERVAYLLKHPTYLKKCGGTPLMLGYYLEKIGFEYE